MASMPQPTEQHRALQRLAGDWEGPEQLSPSPWGPGGPATGRASYRMGVDGFFLSGDYEERKEGRVVFRGHSVFGVDRASGDVCWYWFDSMGQPPAAPSRGRWDGERLVFVTSFPQGGAGRYVYEFLGPDRYRFSLEAAQDGTAFQQVMSGDYRRVASPDP